MIERTKRVGTGDEATHCIRCPACDDWHCMPTAGPRGWGFNGNLERPTFTPSLLVTGGGRDIRCHSFITDGRIRFLSDCTHALVSQEVELPPVGDP